MKRYASLIVRIVLLAVLSGAFLPQTAGQAASPSAAPSDSWPQVQGDAQHSGYASQSVGAPYTKLWQRDTPPVSSRVQPIVAANLVFLPSNDGSLYALNTSNGQTAWHYATGGALVNSAGYAGGKVFFGSTDRYVYAVNANNGTLAWRYLTGGTVKGAPALADGKVFIGSSDGYLYALNQSDGSLAWRFNVGAPVYDTPAYDNGKVFFGGMNSVGYALNASNGNQVWRISIPGQGFRDRWTVAGNGYVFFTPMLFGNHHTILNNGTTLMRNTRGQSWSAQRSAIVSYLNDNPYAQPLFVVNQNSGQEAFTPPVLYASGGSMSPHSQVVLLPNGNANVVYRRTFGSEPVDYGSTTRDALHVGELVLSSGDILAEDRCSYGAGGWNNCGSYKAAFTSDESATMVRSGSVLYLDVARGTYGLNTANETVLKTVACYSSGMGFPFYLPDCLVTYDDYDPDSSRGWRLMYDNILSESSSDGNDLKRPTAIAGNTLYILHYNTLAAVRGTLQGASSANRSLQEAAIPAVDAAAGAENGITTLDASASEVRAALEAHVAEMVGLGHMAPTLYFLGLGGGDNLGWPAYFYTTPNETLYSLSVAYPYLSSSLQQKVKTYLQDEIKAYPPHSVGVYLPSAGPVGSMVGARREYFTPNLALDFNFWPGPSVHVSVLDSVWVYSNNTGDWSYATNNYSALKSIYTAFKGSNSIQSYPELAGVLGFAHIAQHLGHSSDYQDANQFAQAALNSAANFAQFAQTAANDYPANKHGYDASVFMFHRQPIAVHFNAEIGQFLHDRAAASVAAYSAQVEKDIPLWWLTGTAFSHGENAYTSPEIAWTNFMLHAYVLDTPFAELVTYLDAPDRKGDLLYIQKLAAALDFSGPDLGASSMQASSNTPANGETVTYVITIRNTGAPLTADVSLANTLPSGLTYVPGSMEASLGTIDDDEAPKLEWRGSMGETPTVTISYQVTVNVPEGETRAIHNTATIQASGLPTVSIQTTIIANGKATFLPFVRR
ncbi:MAG: PQQ-binding-like beta-propeller repeat protein [Chloroflexota bacterium]